MKVILGLLLILAGLAALGYVGIYVMLYGGIMAAVNNWGVDNGAVVWGIIRAVFFEVGCLVSLPFWAAAGLLLHEPTHPVRKG